MNIEIANRLVQLRKEKGYSQEALAEQLGISRQAVSKWERAESSPDTSNLITLAKLYGVSLDKLLDTDQAQFESEEPLKVTDGLDHRVEKEKKNDETNDHDYVRVGWQGVHVKDGEDEVHIGWNGIQVSEEGKEVVRLGPGYNESEWRFGVIDGSDPHRGLIDGSIALVVLCIYLWVGFEHRLWHPGWIMFLAVPVMSSLTAAIKTKNAGRFAFPVLITGLYLYGGFVLEVWHPTWISFLTVPIYYNLVNWAKRKKRVKSDSETSINETNT